jgi:hypothetical protein
MFLNNFYLTDPTSVACSRENPQQQLSGVPHTNYYRPSFYKAPFDFVIKPAETIIVHFNAPPSVRFLTRDHCLDRFTDKDVTLAVTNESKEPFHVDKDTLLESIIENIEISSDFRLTSSVYRHQIVIDTYNDDVVTDSYELNTVLYELQTKRSPSTEQLTAYVTCPPPHPSSASPSSFL